MASYSVQRAKHATLGVSIVDSVSFSVTGGSIRVRNRSTTVDLYFTLNGTDPTVAGDNTYFVGPGENVILSQPGGHAAVELIAVAACAYSVEVW